MVPSCRARIHGPAHRCSSTGPDDPPGPTDALETAEQGVIAVQRVTEQPLVRRLLIGGGRSSTRLTSSPTIASPGFLTRAIRPIDTSGLSWKRISLCAATPRSNNARPAASIARARAHRGREALAGANQDRHARPAIVVDVQPGGHVRLDTSIPERRRLRRDSRDTGRARRRRLSGGSTRTARPSPRRSPRHRPTPAGPSRAARGSAAGGSG